MTALSARQQRLAQRQQTRRARLAAARQQRLEQQVGMVTRARAVNQCGGCKLRIEFGDEVASGLHLHCALEAAREGR